MANEMNCVYHGMLNIVKNMFSEIKSNLDSLVGGQHGFGEQQLLVGSLCIVLYASWL